MNLKISQCQMLPSRHKKTQNMIQENDKLAQHQKVGSVKPTNRKCIFLTAMVLFKKAVLRNETTHILMRSCRNSPFMICI